MLRSFEAIVDGGGVVRLLEPADLRAGQRLIVTVRSVQGIWTGQRDTDVAQTKVPTKIEATFTHPRTCSAFTAEMSPLCTREEAVRGLIAGDERGPFLDPPPAGRPYELCIQRTSEMIAPGKTFRDAGVIDGDIIEVRQDMQGGGMDLTNLATIVLTSGMSVAFLKAAASVIVELIKSRERVLEFEKEGKKYKLSMRSNVDDMLRVIKLLAGPEGLGDALNPKEGASEVEKASSSTTMNTVVGTAPRSAKQAKPSAKTRRTER